MLGYRIGAQPFAVTVDLPRGGGLYSDGFVTYRGVDVGRITSLSLSPKGAVATLAIDPGTQIPADAVARVHDLSVAGEQYLDLVPPAVGWPGAARRQRDRAAAHRGPGVGVPAARRRRPADRQRERHEVKTITEALGTGLAGTGPDLRAITVAAERLVGALQAARAATVTIINDARARAARRRRRPAPTSRRSASPWPQSPRSWPPRTPTSRPS